MKSSLSHTKPSSPLLASPWLLKAAPLSHVVRTGWGSPGNPSPVGLSPLRLDSEWPLTKHLKHRHLDLGCSGARGPSLLASTFVLNSIPHSGLGQGWPLNLVSLLGSGASYREPSLPLPPAPGCVSCSPHAQTSCSGTIPVIPAFQSARRPLPDWASAGTWPQAGAGGMFVAWLAVCHDLRADLWRGGSQMSLFPFPHLH